MPSDERDGFNAQQAGQYGEQYEGRGFDCPSPAGYYKTPEERYAPRNAFLRQTPLSPDRRPRRVHNNYRPYRFPGQRHPPRPRSSEPWKQNAPAGPRGYAIDDQYVPVTGFPYSPRNRDTNPVQRSTTPTGPRSIEDEPYSPLTSLQYSPIDSLGNQLHRSRTPTPRGRNDEPYFPVKGFACSTVSNFPNQTQQPCTPSPLDQADGDKTYSPSDMDVTGEFLMSTSNVAVPAFSLNEQAGPSGNMDIMRAEASERSTPDLSFTDNGSDTSNSEPNRDWIMSPGPAPQVRVEGDAGLFLSSPEQPIPSAITGNTTAQQPANVYKILNNFVAPTPMTPASAFSLPPGFSLPPASTPSESSPGAPQQDGLQIFLDGLEPPLGHLRPFLEQVGLCTLKDLDDLASMSASEWDHTGKVLMEKSVSLLNWLRIRVGLKIRRGQLPPEKRH